MLLPISHGAKAALRSISASRCRIYFPQTRTVSISSAIHKGVYKDTERRDRRQPRLTRDRDDQRTYDPSSNFRSSHQEGHQRRRQYGQGDEERGRGGLRSRPIRTDRRETRGSRGDPAEGEHTTSQASYPRSVPHTTAASQFLYGYSTVYAALRAGRRRCYKLYLHTRGATRDEQVKEQDSLRRLARQLKVSIVDGDLADVRLLDKMSEGRPHNGIVLEASPLPILSLSSLSKPVSNDKMDYTSFAAEHVSSRQTHLTSINHQPLLLLVDDVLDGGNLGAILRSAYFLGVDAVLLTAHVAPLNAVALKASAGAAEALHIFRVEDPGSVLRQSKGSGWHVIAATTPGQQDGFGTKGRKRLSPSTTPVTISERGIRYHVLSARTEADITARLRNSPQILVIGGEGRGLRPFITKEADSFLEVLSPRQKSIAEVGLDSLNVSVATAVAVQEVLGRMRAGEKDKQASTVETRETEAEVGEEGRKMFTLAKDSGSRKEVVHDQADAHAVEEELRVSSG